MGKKSILILVPLLIFAVPIVSEAADTNKSETIKWSNKDKSKTFRKGRAPAKSSLKVERFLRDIMNATSFEEVCKRFKRANFSKHELDLLKKQLRKPTYSRKLQRLGKKSESAIKAKAKARVQQRSKQKLRTLAKRKEQRLKNLNRNAKTTFVKMKKRSPSNRRSTVAVLKTFTPSMKAKISFEETLLGRTSRESRRRWGIDSVEPLPAVPGNSVTITGYGFGSSQGNVEIVFEERRTMFRAAPVTWAERKVVVDIPLDISSFIGRSEKDAAIWVKPVTGGGFGPGRHIRIQPAIPEITVLSTNSITPGQEITIGGRNFLSGSRGTVVFEFGVHRFRGIISEWTNDVILVRLPSNISGMLTTRGQVCIENPAGNSACKEISFQPKTEIVVLEDIEGHICWGLLGYREYIQLWTNELLNGWRVVDTEIIAIRKKTWRSGCSFEHRPETGSTDATTEIILWCDAFNWIPECRIHLFIEGPVGTPHGAGGRRSSPVPFR